MNGIPIIVIVAIVRRQFIFLVLTQAVAVIKSRHSLESAAFTNKPTLEAKNLPTQHHQRKKRGESRMTASGHGAESKGVIQKNQSWKQRTQFPESV